MGICVFIDWHAYKEKLQNLKENVHKSKQISVGKVARLARQNLISPCNCRVKSALAGGLKIHAGKTGII